MISKIALLYRIADLELQVNELDERLHKLEKQKKVNQKQEIRINKLAKAIQAHLGCDLEEATDHADTIVHLEEVI